MRDRPGFAGGAVSGPSTLLGRLFVPLFVAHDDDVTHEFAASKNPGFTIFRDVHRLIRAHQKRESLFEREASNDPRNFVRFCAEEWPTNALTVHALSEYQD